MFKKLMVILFILSLFLINVFADTSILIDFHKLKANGNGLDPAQSLGPDDPQIKDYTNHEMNNRTEHMPTLIDYSNVAGTSFTPEEKKVMRVSLSCYNWDVILNSSAASVDNKRNSFCTEWHTRAVDILLDNDTHAPEEPPQGYNILGIKVKFSEYPNHNNWALIKPPFEIPAYENIETDYRGNQLEKDKIEFKGNKFEDGYGVIKNVGLIKRIEMRVYGCNYNNSIAVLIKDDNNVVREYSFPTRLNFDGWRNLVYENPNYIENVAHRNLFIVPLYPKFEPFIKLYGFRIYRPGESLGGDFITYIRDVKVTYDKAVIERDEPIKHEEVWHLLRKKALEVKEIEIKKLGYKHILRFLEKLKMHKEPEANKNQ